MSVRARIEWEEPPGCVPEAYLVERLDDDPESRWVMVAKTSDRGIVVEGLPEWGVTTFGVRPVIAGVLAPPDRRMVQTLTRRMPGFAVPVPLTGFTATQRGWDVAFTWDDVATNPNAEVIEIRQGADWDTGRVRVTVPYTDRTAIVGAEKTGSQTFFARPRDSLGRYAPGGDAALVIVYPDEYYPVKTTTSEEPAFGGTGDGTEVVASSLRSEAIPTTLAGWGGFLLSHFSGVPRGARYRPNATYETGVLDRGAVVVERLDVDLSAAVLGSTCPLSAWRWPTRRAIIDGVPQSPNARPIGNRISRNGKPRDGLGVRVEVAASATNPTGGAFVRWIPGSVYRFRYIKLRLVLTDPTGLFGVSVGTFAWTLRRRNLKKHARVQLLAADATGTTVTFDAATPFTAAPDVTLTTEVAGSARVELVDGSTTATNFRAKLYDHAGTRIDGYVRYHALGE